MFSHKLDDLYIICEFYAPLYNRVCAVGKSLAWARFLIRRSRAAISAHSTYTAAVQQTVRRYHRRAAEQQNNNDDNDNSNHNWAQSIDPLPMAQDR